MSAAWAIEALLASALLMALVLAVRGPARRAFGAQVAYALWALPVSRLLLPPLPEGWHVSAMPTLPAAQPITVYLGHPVATLPPVAHGGGIGWLQVLLAIWVIGAAACLAWHVAKYLRFRHRVLRNGVAVDRIRSITIVESMAASGPLAFGVIDRVVVLPCDFAARYDARERELALAHELGHHARGDLIASWIALAVLALHWFNPLAWFAFRAFRADQEMANDARVLAGRDPALRHAYACAIVKSAHGGAVSATCHLHTVNDLKGRLRMIGTSHVSRPRLASGAAVLALAIAGGLGLTASGSATAAAIKARVGDTIGVDLQAGLPAAPRPPAVAPVAPPAPGTVDGTEDIGTGTTNGGVIRKRVIRVRGGGERVDDTPGVPEVSSINCDSDGKGTLYADEMVVTKTAGGRKMIVICSDRVARAAAEGARMGVEMAANGADMERNAMATARDSLRTARAAIESERNLNDAQRREALAGLDQAQAEIDAQIAKGE